jgi:hypothetical protein
MLDGIHVLNKVAETENPEWGIWASIAIFIIIVIIAYIVVEKTDDNGLCPIILLIGLAISFMVFLFISENYKTPTGKYTYQVTMDKSVDFSEFNSKYEIIKTEGKIYTITEK